MTDLEKELAYALADVLIQNCAEEELAGKDECVFSGFIRSHSTALRLMVRLGIFKDRFPGKQDDDYYRGYEALAPPNWELVLKETKEWPSNGGTSDPSTQVRSGESVST